LNNYNFLHCCKWRFYSNEALLVENGGQTMKREPIEGVCCVGITNESGRQPSGFAKVSAMILQSPDLGMDGPVPSQTAKVCIKTEEE
jgi:hypothetical protein